VKAGGAAPGYLPTPRLKLAALHPLAGLNASLSGPPNHEGNGDDDQDDAHYGQPVKDRGDDRPAGLGKSEDGEDLVKLGGFCVGQGRGRTGCLRLTADEATGGPFFDDW
jgi:hypothetical protein